MKKLETKSTVLLKHHLKSLKMPTMHDECEKIAARCAKENVDHLGFLLQLCEQELIDREKRAAERRLRAARFPNHKTLEDFKFETQPTINRVLVSELMRGEYIDPFLAELIELCWRLHRQQPRDRRKLYSLDEPEVMCISKGKAHKRYEFGQKISVATTNRGNWVLSATLCPDNPYDGHTLAAELASVEENSGVAVTDAYVDKGYRGHDYQGDAAIHIAGSSHRGLSRTKRKRRRRRSAVEPIIGHMKSDHRMGRCFLKGLAGDAINAILAAAGQNLRKLLRRFVFAMIFWLSRPTNEWRMTFRLSNSTPIVA